jgi:hypothetical protein
LFQCSSSFRPEDAKIAEVGCFPNRRSAFLRFLTNKLVQIFSQNSSTQNYDPEFQKFKKQKEKTKLNFKSKNLEEYNCPFSLDELRKSLDKALHVAPTISEDASLGNSHLLFLNVRIG